MAMKRMHTNSNYCSVAAQAIIPSVARSKQGGRGLGGAGSRWRLSFVLCASQESSQIALLISITLPALLLWDTSTNALRTVKLLANQGHWGEYPQTA